MNFSRRERNAAKHERQEGYEVDHSPNGRQALRQALEGRYDLILLDVMLPGLSGFDLLKELRKVGNQTMVLMLTVREQEMDKVRGLKLGADDYVTKPFSVMELMARVSALLRRGQSHDAIPRRLTTGGVTVDFRARKAWKGARPVDLTHREFQILEILAAHRGEAVSRAGLVSSIWGTADNVEVSTRTVDQHIAALRCKLGEDPVDPQLIETVYGYGFRLKG